MAAPSIATQGFNINPTSVTFGALLFAFLFYATVKGDLAKWFGVFGLAGNSNPPVPGNNTGAGDGSPLIPALGSGIGFGQLGSITGASPQFTRLSGGDTGWMNTTSAPAVGGGDTGWMNTTSAPAVGGSDAGWIAT